jgi:hypothetical protein
MEQPDQAANRSSSIWPIGHRRLRRYAAAEHCVRCARQSATGVGHAHYDERCFLPIHVYDAANARPVVVLLRPGKTPSGEEIRGHLRRMVRRIRRHWPHTRITIRGDCHYGRHEVMTWCEANGLRYVFGLSSNVVLEQMVEPLADAVRAQRAEAQAKLVALRRTEPPVDAGWLRRVSAHRACHRRSSWR